MRLRCKLYDYSDAATIKDIIPHGFIEKLNVKNTLKRDSREKRDKYVRGVFFDFIKLLVTECIENNVKFISPNWASFVIYIREKRDFERKKILTLNKTYLNVNLIESNGKFYEFVLRSKYLTPKQWRSVRIGYSTYKVLVDKVNKGKRYFVK